MTKGCYKKTMWKEVLTDTDSSLVALGIRVIARRLRQAIGPKEQFFPEPKPKTLGAQSVHRRCKRQAKEWIEDYSLFDRLFLCPQAEERYFLLVLSERAFIDEKVRRSPSLNQNVIRELSEAFGNSKKMARETLCQRLNKDSNHLSSQNYFRALEKAAQFVHLAISEEEPFFLRVSKVLVTCNSFRPEIQNARNAFYGNVYFHPQ